jgi:hypothetical protein
MLQPIIAAIEEYKTRYRRPGLAELQLSKPYALFPKEMIAVDGVESRWPDEWPHSRKAGLYFIFSGGGQLLYIGKASMSHCIGKRLSNYFGTERGTKGCLVVHGGWGERPTYVATMAVPEDMSFEAAAIEEFLIRFLNPPTNTMGVL